MSANTRSRVDAISADDVARDEIEPDEQIVVSKLRREARPAAAPERRHRVARRARLRHRERVV